MIKSLFGEEDEPKQKKSKPEIISEEAKKTEISADVNETAEVLSDVSKEEIDTQNDVVDEEIIKTEDEIETIEEIRTAIETGVIPQKITETVKPFEIERPIGQPEFGRKSEGDVLDIPMVEKLPQKSERELELEKKLAEIEAELLAEKENQSIVVGEIQSQKTEPKRVEQLPQTEELEQLADQIPNLKSENSDANIISSTVKENDNQKINISKKDYHPESKGETMRKTGLAWSAGIALFGSVIFMMVLGWFADLLLGTNPWGILFGIIIGGIIGFVQFFRITSQIINPKPNDFEKVSLNSNLYASKPIVDTGILEEKKPEDNVVTKEVEKIKEKDIENDRESF